MIGTTGYETTVPIKWKRSCSVFNDEIVFPAGTPVVNEGGTYYIAPCAAKEDSILRHDLTYYGCAVDVSKVKINARSLS